jgi:hypothetical protein
VIGIDPATEPRKWLYLAEGETTYWKGRVLRSQNVGGNPTALGIAEAEVTVPREGKTD